MITRTKNCLDPWSFVLCKANGDLQPCCWHPPVGNLSDSSMENILADEKIQELRKQLLDGSLNDFCRKCPAREDCTTEELTQKVTIYLQEPTSHSISQGKLIKH